MLFMAAMAASASASWVKRTNPKPRLRPVSRSLTTTYRGKLVRWVLGEKMWDGRGTYSLLNGAELLELGAKSLLIRVPRKASV